MLPPILLAATLAFPVPPAPTSAALLAQVSEQRLKQNIDTLAAFGTRHTLSDTTSDTRGIGAARRWIKSQFDSFNPAGGTLRAQLESFDVPKGPRVPTGANIVNVVAVLPGTRPESAQRTYYVVGHFDSRNGDAMDVTGDAPGANDDASGASVVIELARVLADHPLESTVVFLCTAGEEQGLLGAKAHAESKVADKAITIRGVLNNDIVGDPWGHLRIAPKAPGEPWTLPPTDPATRPANLTVRIFSEGLPRTSDPERLARIRSLAAEYDSPSRQLARYIASVAEIEQTAVQPAIIFRPDRFLRGGDHSAFNEAGFTAVRFTVPNEDFSRQHADVKPRDGKPYGDVPEFIDPAYLANVARLNLATLIHLANAPDAPANVQILTANLTNDSTLRWEASKETDAAGYEVVWRDTTQWQWTHVQDVGAVTQITLPISKDNVFFGVRAYDKDGYRSPVTFAVDAKK